MQATLITLTDAERQDLGALARRPSTSQQIARRARIVLTAAEGGTNTQVARQVGLSRESVRLWRDRWAALQDIPLADLGVAARLADAPRPGAPTRITPAQVCQVVALACAAPDTSGRPISRWTNQEIADEMTKRGLIASISPRHAARLVKRGTLSPI